MALRKKPTDISEREIEQRIERGGSIATEVKKRAKTSNFPLRFVREDIAERIDSARAKRTVAPSVNSWINEAIIEKLEREKL